MTETDDENDAKYYDESAHQSRIVSFGVVLSERTDSRFTNDDKTYFRSLNGGTLRTRLPYLPSDPREKRVAIWEVACSSSESFDDQACWLFGLLDSYGPRFLDIALRCTVTFVLFIEAYSAVAEEYLQPSFFSKLQVYRGQLYIGVEAFSDQHGFDLRLKTRCE